MKSIEWVRKGTCIICVSHAPQSTGYPVLRRKGRLHLIHRLVCERRHGPLGESNSLHSCDTPACINPDHLRPGTQLENGQDAVDRNRYNPAKGEASGKAVLTERIAKQIYSATGTHRKIAEQFSTDHRTVGRIKRKEAWDCIHR